ncbi:hypothetical protein GCM10022200_22970 [Microbacterium awajiense]|uniref:YdhG-like domain-containing protein n=1 Tax=Microbacterium awajiense TaxID=415214 RepID=A0ABP7ASD2_9MICO
MKKTGGDVAEFIAGVTPAKRREDAISMVDLVTEVTGLEPELWGTIIGFGACHYRYPTGNEGDSPIIGFSPRKQATTVYLLDGVDAHRDDLTSLGPHKTGVGCLYIPDVEAVDRDALKRILSDAEQYVRSGGGQYANITVID